MGEKVRGKCLKLKLAIQMSKEGLFARSKAVFHGTACVSFWIPPGGARALRVHPMRSGFGVASLTRAVWGQGGDPGHPSLWLWREVRAWRAGSPPAPQRPSVPLLLPSRGHGHCLRARRPCHLHGVLFFLGLCLVAYIPCGCQPGPSHPL